MALNAENHHFYEGNLEREMVSREYVIPFQSYPFPIVSRVYYNGPGYEPSSPQNISVPVGFVDNSYYQPSQIVGEENSVESVKKRFEAIYWLCEENIGELNSFEISQTHSVGGLTQKDIKIITVKWSNFIESRTRSWEQLQKHLDLMASEDEIVFTQKVKNQREYSTDKFRGSKFIGVSKNGKSWQVYIVIDKAKKYIGWFKTKMDAAAMYDKLAINFHGLRVSIKQFS